MEDGGALRHSRPGPLPPLSHPVICMGFFQQDRPGLMVGGESPYGRVPLPVYLYPGIRPDTVSIPIGQGHHSYGRYATGRGANPMDVLPFHADTRTGAIGLNSTRVRIVKNGETGRLVKMEGSTQELGRNIVPTPTPEEFVKL